MPPGEADAGPRVSPRAPLCGEHVNAVGRNARAGHQTKVMGKRLRDEGPIARIGVARGEVPRRPGLMAAGREFDEPLTIQLGQEIIRGLRACRVGA